MSRARSAVLLSVLLAVGCARATTAPEPVAAPAPPPLPTPPTYPVPGAAPQPAAIPPPPQPPPEAAPAPPPGATPPVAAPVPPEPAPVKKPPPAAPVPPPSPPPVVSPQMPRPEEERLRREASLKIEGTEQIIGRIDGKRLAPDQQELLSTIQSFLTKARTALTDHEFERAFNLADKAGVLAEDLSKAVR